jgi:putative ABC transport system permease protein
VNVANLLLGRALGRQREMAVRAALGAGRARLAGQLLTEALLLAAVAAAGGLALAGAAVEYFQKANPIELPPSTTVGIDGTVLGFSAALGVLTAILFGLFPAWKASRTELNQALKSSGRAPSQDSLQRRFGQGLVVFEIVLTVVLLTGAGLLIRSVEQFASAPLGFVPDHLLSASFRLPRSGYDQPAQRARFYDRALQEVRVLPQVQAAALSTGLPTGNGGNVTVIAVDGRPDPPADQVLDASLQTVSPGYFTAMGIPLLRGREFSDADRAETQPVAVVNAAFVQKYFPDESPIGRKIREFRQGDNAANPWLTVVGVAGDKKQPSPYNAMEWQNWPLVYRAVAQNPPPAINLFIRTARAGSALGADVQRIVAALDPAVALGALETVNHSLSRILAYPRFRAVLLTAFAGLALLLALVGLYGILSRQVTLRTNEIGIRMALGAQRTEVRAMILKEGLILTACGLAAGVAASWITGRSLAALLYGISASDPLLLTGISAVVLLTALAATWFPARRATAVDPAIALRYE